VDGIVTVCWAFEDAVTVVVVEGKVVDVCFGAWLIVIQPVHAIKSIATKIMSKLRFNIDSPHYVYDYILYQTEY
jgi:hypothetical protein